MERILIHHNPRILNYQNILRVASGEKGCAHCAVTNSLILGIIDSSYCASFGSVIIRQVELLSSGIVCP